MAPPKRAVLAAAAAASLALGRYAPSRLLFDSVLSTTAALFFAYLVSRTLWSWLIWPHFFSPLRHLPQPSNNHVLMGQWFRILREPTGQPHKAWMDEIPNDGIIYYRGVFNSERVVLTTPKGLGEALTTKSYDLVKPRLMTQDLARILGVGVLLAEGDEHKRQRKSLAPAFAYRHIKDLYPVFWNLTRDLVLAVDKELAANRANAAAGAQDPSTIRLDLWASRATLDIIGVAGMGKSFNAIQDPDSKLYRVYQSIFSDSRANRVLGLLSLVVPYFVISNLPLQRNADLTHARAEIRKVCYDLIQEKKARLQADAHASAGIDILSVALQSGGFTDDNLIDQLMTFLAAGHETTATAMSWAMLLLTQHPGVQAKLRDELRRAGLPDIRSAADTVGAEQIDRLAYLQAVVNEVLRFHPPVPFTLRIAERDTTLLGHFVPRGTSIIYAPVAINHSKAFWGPDADEFKPERWIGPGRANTGGADSNYANMTFLHGPRSCIGQGFSKAEFACLLAGWVLAFDSVLADPEREIEVQGGVTQRIKGGLELRVRGLDA